MRIAKLDESSFLPGVFIHYKPYILYIFTSQGQYYKLVASNLAAPTRSTHSEALCPNWEGSSGEYSKDLYVQKSLWLTGWGLNLMNNLWSMILKIQLAKYYH